MEEAVWPISRYPNISVTEAEWSVLSIPAV